MKRKHKAHAWLAALALSSATHATAATVIIGDGLTIGSHADNNMGMGSGQFGLNNVVETNFSLSIGKYNLITHNDNENSSFALGAFNSLIGYYSLVGGSYNMVWDSGSITFGYYNYNNAPNSIVIGTGNVAEYDSNKNGIVAGKYSALLPIATPAYLVIGNGTSSKARSNSFVVFENGDVLISKPQGDISMGIYQ